MVNFVLIFLLKVHVQPASGTCITPENETVGKYQYTGCLFLFTGHGTRQLCRIEGPASADTSRDGFGKITTFMSPIVVRVFWATGHASCICMLLGRTFA